MAGEEDMAARVNKLCARAEVICAALRGEDESRKAKALVDVAQESRTLAFLVGVMMARDFAADPKLAILFAALIDDSELQLESARMALDLELRAR